uniref:non-specific serine/threonine protein kinase n=1 Tax=Odontella aurita TaxID=265563 RepID=A0A7S4MHQ6_9STRA|mmetsp:Transcript_21839/g.64440  ORF Transcript_21839/g.64440 Transcript_21839/m.64440 type:complete len:399 (+) Transcript_21839:406-1602(+)
MFSSTSIGKKAKKGGAKLRVWQHRTPGGKGGDGSGSTKKLGGTTSPAARGNTTSTVSTGADRDGGGPLIEDEYSDLTLKYDVDSKELGSGMYGVVRKCTDRETGGVYAVKTIKKARVAQIGILRQEVQLLREVSHPSIIELVDVFEDKEEVHLVTELATGGELFDRIIAKKQSPEKKFTEKEAALIIRQILDAVSYLHDVKDIVHRDIKPENFLFSSDADDAPIKVIDFGYAVRHIPKEHGPLREDVGTPLYMAPEVIQKKYNCACDVWSVGIIAYTLLAGFPPFNGLTEQAIYASVSEGKFRFPSPYFDGVSAKAKDFICKVLKKDPKLRIGATTARFHPWILENAPAEGDHEPRLMVSASSSNSPKKGTKSGKGGVASSAEKKMARRMLSPSRFTY